MFKLMTMNFYMRGFPHWLRVEFFKCSSDRQQADLLGVYYGVEKLIFDCSLNEKT